MKHFFWFIVISILMAGDTILASDIVITLYNDNTLSLPYCWKKGNQITFDIPRGAVGLNMSDVKTIEERLVQSDIDSQYLNSNAIDWPSKDSFTILKDFIAQRRGLSVNPAEKTTRKSDPGEKKASSPSEAKLIAPVTKTVESYVQAFKDSRDIKILVGFFVNAREELEGRECSIKLLDINKKSVLQHPLKILRLSLSEEERIKNKISPFFYLIYGNFSSNVEFWAYDVVCEIPTL